MWDGATITLKKEIASGVYIALTDTQGNEAVIAEADEGLFLPINWYGENEGFVFRVNDATSNTVFPAILVSNGK